MAADQGTWPIPTRGSASPTPIAQQEIDRAADDGDRQVGDPDERQADAHQPCRLLEARAPRRFRRARAARRSGSR